MRIRTATVDDAEALAVIHLRGWQTAYRGLVPQDRLDHLDPVPRVPGWRRWIAEDPGFLVLQHETGGAIGFVNVSARGEIVVLYLLPEFWGRGGGQLLMRAALRRLAEAGLTEATLWVLAANGRARRFYEAGGWRADGTSRTDDSRGFPMVEVRYRRDLTPGDA